MRLWTDPPALLCQEIQNKYTHLKCRSLCGQVNVLAVSENRPGDLTVPVAAFYQRLSGELGEKGVILSVQTTERALRGDNTLSGVTAEVLAQQAGRVWLPASAQGTDYAALLTAVGLEDAASRIVVENASAGSWYR